MIQPVMIKLQNEGDIITIRARAREFTQLIGFSLNDQYRIDLCILELAHNVLLYAGEGTISLEIIHKGTTPGLQITCRDHGPGIVDCQQALIDGWSTRSSLGLGLPTIQRLADDFRLNSSDGKGTTVVIQKWLEHKSN